MRALSAFDSLLTRLAVLSLVFCALGLAAPAAAQTKPRPPWPKGTKYRVKIDSQPQQAAIYLDDKAYGIEGYTPSTLRLPKGPYKIILELPGFRSVEKVIEVRRAEQFVFTLERERRPAIVDVRSTAGDTASGGQLFVDGAPMGTVPARVELQAGHHLVEVKKPGYKDYRDSVDSSEGEQRTLVIELQPELKKGAVLVTADVSGAEVYVDGQRRDTAPTLVGDLVEGPHTIEVRHEGVPPFRSVVQVIGNQQAKVEARLKPEAPPPPPPPPTAQVGVLRVLTSAPGAEVMVDGEPKGPANAEIPGLRPGQHVVEVRAPGREAQVVEAQVVAGEQRVVRVELQAAAQKPQTAKLQVVTPVPDAEVFIDGALAGKAPVERELSAGKHFVVVRKAGYAEWKREVAVEAGQPVSLTAELSASGSVKFLANVPGAEVLIDGQVVGKTPLLLDTVQAGDHLAEVRAPGHVPAKQPFHVEGGEQKILSAELAPVRTGPTATDMARTYRAMSSFSAVTLEPGKFTLDIAGGFFPFAQLRLTVGAFRRGMLGLDAGVELRTHLYYTDGGAHVKFQFLKAGPIAIGTSLFLGGGGGPDKRNDFTFELGVPVTLLFGDLVRFTAHPYWQIVTDKLCPTPEEIAGGIPAASLADGCKANGLPNRDVTNRLMLQAALEISVHQSATLFLIFEGDPVSQRRAFRNEFAPIFPWKSDPQIYGRLGVTFKF